MKQRPILSAAFGVLCLFMMGRASAQTNISVHDPVMIRQDSVYYAFFTGQGVSVWSSVNRLDRRRESPVFDKPPQWAVDAIPGFRGSIWAPDISYHNGLYYLYYAVSAFGKNTSCIGLRRRGRQRHPAYHQIVQ